MFKAECHRKEIDAPVKLQNMRKKIGYPLILSAGLGIVTEIRSFAPVIADLKVADTPNTNRLIGQAVLDAGAGGIIAQAFPGKDSLQAGADYLIVGRSIYD